VGFDAWTFGGIGKILLVKKIYPALARGKLDDGSWFCQIFGAEKLTEGWVGV
jgi:hypothetical protein